MARHRLEVAETDVLCSVAGLDGSSGITPALEAAVEDRDGRVPEISERPPGPGRRRRVPLVVAHDGSPGSDPVAAHRLPELLAVWERVAAPPPRRPGQFGIEVDKGCPRNMSHAAVLAPGRAEEPPPHIEDGDALTGHERHQRRRVDQYCGRRPRLFAGSRLRRWVSDV